MSDATVLVSIAFAIVWMKRKQRWYLFFKALEGAVSLNSGGAAAASTPTSSTASTPTSSTPTNTNTSSGQGQTVPGATVQPS